MRYVVLAMLASGCAVTMDAPTSAAGQNEAVTMIWSALGAQHDAPRIEWVNPDAACDRPGDTRRAFLTAGGPNGNCAYGEYEYDDGLAKVVWQGGLEGALHETALAHELIHAWQFKDRGIADSRHLIVADWNRVNPLNELLAGAGY